MAALNELLKEPWVKWTLIFLIIIIVIVFLTFFIQYNIDRTNGKHVKFLWFESNIVNAQSQISTHENFRNSDATTLGTQDKMSEKGAVQVSSYKQKKEEQSTRPITITNSKNVNTGENYGNIGDTYTGMEQRHFSAKQSKELINEIELYKTKYGDQINNSHITIGYPGDKESQTVAAEAEKILHAAGFNDIQVMTLLTYGVTGKLFEVSNAPDSTILIEIFPADNVQ